MILFISYGGGHVACLAPLALTMQSKNIPFKFLALTTASSYLNPLGISALGFKDLPEATASDVQHWGKLLAKDVPSNGTVSIEETVAYLGLNFRELVTKHGEQEAFDLYAIHGRQAFLPVEVMKSALNYLKPELLVTTNSPRTERAAVIAARELGIDTICIVDLFALQEVQWVGELGYADRICVLNEAVRTMFIKHGRQPHEVVVTGNPAFDRLITQETKLAGLRLKQSRGWDDGKINILWASQPEPEKHPFTDKKGDPQLPRKVEYELRRFVAQNADFRLIVRYHPSETEEFITHENVEFSPLSENLAALLNAVDTVIVTASTVGLEASIVGCNVISVDCSIFTEDAPYSTMGISQGVKQIKDLASAILGITVNKNDTSQIKKLKKNQPNATNLILSQINSILSKQ